MNVSLCARPPAVWLACLLSAFFLLSPSLAIAEDEAATSTAAASDSEAAEAAPVTPEQDTTYTINTIVMFLCAVLVLFMQAGFAMLEVGLNAAKNTVNILSKNLLDLAVGVLLFFIVGYGLMYPGGDYAGKWFGFGGVGVQGLGMEVKESVDPASDTPWSPNADFLFQVAFAATAATIVSGAVAGRMKFSAYLVYSALITGLIYPISGMWKWGGGWLAERGFHDFAGSVVVHAVGGFAGLAGAIILGPRIGRFVKGKSIPMPGHNIAFAALGVFVLWVGWYGFNPGSLLTYSGSTNAAATVYIAVTTTLAAAAGTVSALILAWLLFKKPDLTMALNGALAGLVGITANCDQVALWAALVIGAVAGLLVVLGVILLDKLRIDDPVGAWPVHGLCGMWGGIATGLFGTAENLSLGVQVLGTLAISAWAFFTMLGVFLALRAVGMLRVSPEEEQSGLDISEHGMHAYPPQWIVDSYVGSPIQGAGSYGPGYAGNPIPAMQMSANPAAS
jgi:ammonium transporter, Amt family